MRGLSPVAASGGHSSSRCAGLSLSRPLLLWSTGSRRTGSVVVVHGHSCSAACGIFPDQGSNPCPLRWQVDSQPLCLQGSPWLLFFWGVCFGFCFAVLCGTQYLVPRPGSEPRPGQWKPGILTTMPPGTPWRQFLMWFFCYLITLKLATNQPYNEDKMKKSSVL